MGRLLFMAWCSIGATLASGCGGLQVTLHKASVQRPSNVALYYSVETAGGLPVGGLTAESFLIYEDGQLISPYESKQTILNPEVAVVHYTLLLLDLSGSVTESGSVPLLQEAAAGFADRVTKHNHVGVYGFDGSKDIKRIVPFTANGGAVRRGLAALARVKVKDPSTNLNGAVVEALKVLDKQLDTAKQPLRFATLVIFTDGTDRAHRVDERAMLDAIEASRANTFVIGVGAEIHADQLSRIASSRFVRAEDLASVATAFDDVAEFIEASARKFYLLSYCSPARAGTHELKVAVTGAEETGALTHEFDAAGFGPKCDPNRTPSFDAKRIRMPN